MSWLKLWGDAPIEEADLLSTVLDDPAQFNYTPEHMAGRFQGLRILSQVMIPGIIGPQIGAWVLRNAPTVSNSDGTVSFLPSADIFLAALVVLLIVITSLALRLLCTRARRSKA